VKPNALLTVTSLLALVLSTLHLADDIVHGISPGGLNNLIPITFWVVWLLATLLLGDRRSGLVILLVTTFIATGVSVVHMTGKSGVTAGLKADSGGFFFAWTVLALGVTSVTAFLLAARGLWSLRRSRHAGADRPTP
jgi:hypothetical protein